MDQIKFHCPNCLGSISAGLEWAGKSTGCPHCKRLIDIPLLPQEAPVLPRPPATPRRPLGRVTAFVKQRKPFAITICALFMAFIGLQIHLRIKPDPKPDPVSTSVTSDDPFVLSNGYRVQNLRIEKQGSDGRIYTLTDSESYQAFKRREEEARASLDENNICSTCNGTGRSRSTSVSRCPGCSGGGTRLTPSGHRIVCNDCGGTGMEKVDPACIYCQGTGRIKLAGQ